MRRISSIFIVFTVVLLLQSCFVAKQYVRPELETAELYRDFSSTDTLGLGDLRWYQLFTDEKLQALIRTGLANNYDLKIASQQILTAEAFYKQGKAGYLPDISLDGTFTSSEFYDNSFNPLGFDQGGSTDRLDQYDLATNISWEMDIWGRIRSNKRAEGANLLQTQAGKRVVQTRLIASIATAYYQLVSLDAQLLITEQTISIRTKSLQTIRSLKKSGSQTEVAVKQTEAQLHTAEILAVELMQQIKILENTLSILLAAPPQSIDRGNLEEQSIAVDLHTGLPSRLLRNRPDVMQAEYILINRFELTNVARADFYPRLTLNASAGFQSLAFSNWISSASFLNTLGAGVTQPLFNRRRIRTQYEVAQAQQQEALYNFKNSLLIAGQEVSNALITYEAETDKLEIRQEQVNALSEAETYSIELLKNGYANYLEVLRTSDEKLGAELELVNSQLLQLTAMVDLYQALGGGWKD